MRLVDLVGTRFGEGDDQLPVYEGPVAGARTPVDLASACTWIRRTEVELARLGVSPLRVGVLSNHQVETYVAVFASVIGDHTFVPMNPKFPLSRLGQILSLGVVDVILHDAGTTEVLERLDSGLPTVDVSQLIGKPATPAEMADVAAWRSTLSDRLLTDGGIAYVMFTSGSTGTPKGVPVSFESLSHYVDGITGAVPMDHGMRFTQFFDLSFDLSIHDIFVSNRLWGTLVAPSMIDLLMPSGYVSRERIDAWFSVPILGAQLGRSPRNDSYAGLRYMLFCGEALPMETVIACRSWLTDGGGIWNLYGPTEATIAFTEADVTGSERTSGNASIGLPFGMNEVALLVDGVVHRTLRQDLEGELLLGGPQVFAGYSTDAPSPFLHDDGARWYRSGDLVRIDEEGVYFRGRVDSQVKYRGYRIELGEIEVAVRRTYDLSTVAVVLSGPPADPTLVLFYLQSERPSGGDAPMDPAELNTLLPVYMVPGRFVGLETMPTNQNGKIDRRALADREPS